MLPKIFTWGRVGFEDPSEGGEYIIFMVLSGCGLRLRKLDEHERTIQMAIGPRTSQCCERDSLAVYIASKKDLVFEMY